MYMMYIYVDKYIHVHASLVATCMYTVYMGIQYTVYMLCNWSWILPQEKVDYGALVQELGGEYIDLDYFTTKCTHLVVGKSSACIYTHMHVYVSLSLIVRQ